MTVAILVQFNLHSSVSWQTASKDREHMAPKLKKVRKDKDQASNWSRLDVWTRGVIWGMHLGGAPA